MTEGTAVMLAGTPAADLAVMEEAAAAFARRFAEGGQRSDPGAFGLLARPFAPGAPRRRASYIRSDGIHWCL